MNANTLWQGVIALLALGGTVWVCFTVGVLGVMAYEMWVDRRIKRKASQDAIHDRLRAFCDYRTVTKTLDYSLDNGYKQIRSVNDLNADTLPYRVRATTGGERKAA